MSINLNDNIYVNAGKPAEAKYLSGVTKYASISAANIALPIAVRYEGLTVLLADGKEYWYSGGVQDINLVVKILGGTVSNVSASNSNGFSWNITNPTTTPNFSINLVNASATTSGKLTDVDWNVFNNKQSALGFTPENLANKGIANGYTPLDNTNKIPINYLPPSILGGVVYKGTWDASTNTPTLVSSNGTKGYYYVVSVSGTTTLDGINNWVLSDWVIFNGSVWEKVDNTDSVTSFNGRTGPISLNNLDVQTALGGSQTQNNIYSAPSGSNGLPSFRALESSDIPNLDMSKITTGSLDYSRLSNVPATTSGTYVGPSPSTVAVGGIPSGYVLTGKTYDQLFAQMLVVYQSPAFSAFSVNFSSNPLEVGQTIQTTRTFTWSTTNSSNVSTNSISIIDVNNGNTVLASGLANDGTELVTIGTVVNTVPISQQYKIQATNTNSILFNTTYTLTSKYPCFYGKTASGGAGAGVNRPTANQALIASGTKMALSTNESGTITINFNSTSDDYIWFAVPYTGTTKNTWFVTSLNNGSIGGAVSSGGNLFPSPNTVNIDEPTVVLWNGISYKIYISNYQTAVNTNMSLS